MLIERALIRPVEGSPELTLVTVTLGLFIWINGLARWIWGSQNRGFPSMFGDGNVNVGGISTSLESLGLVAVLLGVVGVLWLVFQKTKLGLAMRAAAVNPAASRLVGIPVGRMLMFGWGLAAVCGALAGVLVAPRLFLDPGLMGPVIIYSFAAATLGGFDSPFGAVLGGWIIGVAEALAGGYVDFIGQDLKILVPLAVILTVLLCGPTGCSARLRWHGHETRGVGGRAGAGGPAAVLLQLLPRLAVHARAGLRRRRARAEPAARLQRADLARPRRVLRARRLHDRDPRGQVRLAASGDDPGGGRDLLRRRLRGRDPGAAPARALPRAGDARPGGGDAAADQALRRAHRRDAGAQRAAARGPGFPRASSPTTSGSTC